MWQFQVAYIFLSRFAFTRSWGLSDCVIYFFTIAVASQSVGPVASLFVATKFLRAQIHLIILEEEIMCERLPCDLGESPSLWLHLFLTTNSTEKFLTSNRPLRPLSQLKHWTLTFLYTLFNAESLLLWQNGKYSSLFSWKRWEPFLDYLIFKLLIPRSWNNW